MHRIFREALDEATGDAQSVIVIIADIRGFSAFSMGCDSIDAAMFIKRAYIELIDSYFPFAAFYKSTGDGLLLVVPVSGENILEVSRQVVESCLKSHSEFSKICSDDPMINFKVPDKIGIGVTRGTACCLVSGDRVIDYSGRWLNLASRLTALARPSGIVIDGDFNINLLTDEQRSNFEEANVYLDGIAEDESIQIYFTREFTTIAKRNRQPIAEKRWQHRTETLPFRDLFKFNTFRYDLESEPRSSKDIKVEVQHWQVIGGKVSKEYIMYHYFDAFTYKKEAGRPFVRLDFSTLRERLERERVKKNMNVTIDIAYVEK